MTVAYLATKVLDVALGSANLQCLLLCSLEVLLLANVGHEGDHLIVLVQEVLEDAAGVQTA